MGLGVLRAELEDVADLDRRDDLERLAVDRVGRLRGAHVGAAGLEVPARLDAAEMRVDGVCTDDVLGLRHGAVEEHRRRRIGHPDRAEEADGPDRLRDLLLGRRAVAATEGGRELRVLDGVVPAHEHEHEAVGPDDHDGLERRRLVDAELLGHGGDGLRARGLDPLGCANGIDGDGRRRRGAGHLDVGGVALGEHDVVLARGAGRHVLVRAGAAHHADVRLDPVPAQAAAVVDVRVGLGLRLVGRIQARLVAIERVRVLHHELARAQDARARARLIALLHLHL